MIKLHRLKKLSLLGFIMVLTISFVFAVSGCAPSSYSPEKKSAQLKTPDILKNGVLKVGIDFGNPPLAGETLKEAGIDVDVASALADELGLSVEFVDVGTSPELAIANKKVDIVMGISKATAVQDMWKSDVYIQTACAIFGKGSSSNIPSTEGNDKFSTQMGSSSAIAAQAQFNVSNIKLENSIENCFDSLNNGSVKYVAADAVVGSYFAKINDIDANIVGLLTKPSGYCIGVANSNTNLIQKISQALEEINKGGITAVVEKKWLGKALELDKVQQTPNASNQADAGELDAGVYSQTDPNAEKNMTNY